MRLALAFAVMAAPALAQAPCAGIADVQATLYLNEFRAVASGLITGGSVTVYTHADGRFLVFFANAEKMCLVQTGTEWGAVSPNA